MRKLKKASIDDHITDEHHAKWRTYGHNAIVGLALIWWAQLNPDLRILNIDIPRDAKQIITLIIGGMLIYFVYHEVAYAHTGGADAVPVLAVLFSGIYIAVNIRTGNLEDLDGLLISSAIMGSCIGLIIRIGKHEDAKRYINHCTTNIRDLKTEIEALKNGSKEP